MVDKISLVFFQTTAGNEPVREWLRDLPEENRRAIGQDLERFQYRWPVGMPLAGPLVARSLQVSHGIGRQPVIARVIFCFHEDELVALTGFIKKSQKTLLQGELDLARARRTELSQMKKKRRNRHHGSASTTFSTTRAC